MWINFRSQASLWAKFMKGKYCKGQRPSLISKKLGDSRILTNMLKIRHLTEEMYIWDLGNGQVNFWLDHWCPKNWLGAPPSDFNPYLSVCDLWDGDSWSVTKLQSILQEPHLSQVTKIVFDKGWKDKIIWHSYANQNLTKVIYAKLYCWDQVPWGEAIWDIYLSPSISFFYWRFFNNLLPTDDILKLKGLRGPFRCYLCQIFEEDNNHLFFKCEFAQEVWKTLLTKIKVEGLDKDWSNLKDGCHGWKSKKGDSIPFIVAWFLWMCRNNRKHEDKPIHHSKVTRNCASYLNKLIQLNNFPNISLPQTVIWQPPDQHTMKINIDEAHDALEPELIAIFWALTFALKAAWYKLWIEVDSIQLITFLNTEQLSSWHHIHRKPKIGNRGVGFWIPLANACCSFMLLLRPMMLWNFSLLLFTGPLPLH
ncbi:uncharacterized protein LOC110031333 [Phalaenopsis equestris]|uniref:uncharacterized protein LOC110031333 n=1 Tax=Phalaenopsis equestris TaxID=78828 RepID=UPI0009E30F70|nr:uncharacterized protein LOC110031333 [Phalaenopsis equestris]